LRCFGYNENDHQRGGDGLKFYVDEMGVKHVQILAKELGIAPSYKTGGVRIRKNKARLVRDIKQTLRRRIKHRQKANA
jgi:hypothetical protein